MIAISIFFYRSNISYFNFFHIKYFVFVSVAGNFHHSDCIGGGGGSAESPYNNISSAQSQRGGSSSAFHDDLANCNYDDDGDCDDNNVLLCDTN